MTLKRRTRVIPGYDCRAVCTHTPKAEGRDGHGIHNEEWTYTLIDKQIGAMSLHIGTGRFPPTVDVATLHELGGGFRGAFIAMCTPHATELELVREAALPRECEFLGRCYTYGTWYLLADELVSEHFVYSVQTIEEAQPKLWSALETFFTDQAKRIEVARRETGDLGWHQCPHCQGKGVLPGASS